MATEREDQPKTPETPTIERAPEAPRQPETAQELDDLGSAWENFIDKEDAKAKQEADDAFKKKSA